MTKKNNIVLHGIVISLLIVSAVIIGSVLLKEDGIAKLNDPAQAILLHEDVITLPNTPLDIQPTNNTQEETPNETQETVLSVERKKITQHVPFISQAPSAQWDDPVFQDGCEEASIIMGMGWVRGEKRISKKEAEQEIQSLANAANDKFGASLDLSAQDSFELIRSYYDHTNVRLHTDVDANDIIDVLYKNATVIIPVNGKKLFNPNFLEGGPDNHMLIITGYDPKKEEFITNDPGTRRGEDFIYTKKTIDNALRDYPTGYHEPNTEFSTAMIELWK